MKIRTLAPALTIAAALTLAACSGGETDTDGTETGAEETTSEETAEEPAEEPTEEEAEAVAAQFGPACADIPADGPGSFDGMAQDPVATAASNNPALSTLVDMVTLAELGDTLNGAEDITVFAPANAAFEALPAETVEAAQADPSGLLTQVLTYHVVPERLAPEDLAGTFETLQGAELTVEGSGEDFTVGADGAAVVCGNVQTANATVYIIDGVLLPPSE
ncbi:Uncaracterized surface protein containing fasciclin (FAS1) repeats [Ruania alba]|uniref:Uncaracterized surface protein containing fasciclin (FAS1) repeats n=1 Tax=Ruania alba TaxID=648782 RepID=A0A1H5BIJ3_9MICO|nr:Uncaracterized surface protein containing fasciclin (FAS1) repeats [Ruania alba]